MFLSSPSFTGVLWFPFFPFSTCQDLSTCCVNHDIEGSSFPPLKFPHRSYFTRKMDDPPRKFLDSKAIATFVLEKSRKDAAAMDEKEPCSYMLLEGGESSFKMPWGNDGVARLLCLETKTLSASQQEEVSRAVASIKEAKSEVRKMMGMVPPVLRTPAGDSVELSLVHVFDDKDFLPMNPPQPPRSASNFFYGKESASWINIQPSLGSLGACKPSFSPPFFRMASMGFLVQ